MGDTSALLLDSTMLPEGSVAENATENATLESLESLECTSGSPQEALDNCTLRLSNGTSEDWLEACAIYVCIGGEPLLERTASIAAQSQQIVEKERQRAEASEQEPVALCRTCVQGENCFEDVKWAMEVGISNGKYNPAWAPAINESSCFEEVQAALKAYQSLPDFVVDGMREPKFPEPCGAADERHVQNGLAYCR